MNDIRLSIVVPVFNGIAYTKKCLKSLYQLKDASGKISKQVDIIIVDDGSKDGTSDYIKMHYPEVHLVYGNGGLWWGGGVNKGMKYAVETLNSDYILWWNNDILPQDDYLEQLFSIIETHPRDVVIGSKIFVLNNDLLWGMGGKFDPVSGSRFMYGEKQPDGASYQRSFEVDWFPGMGTSMHRNVIEKIGYVDETRFPQYHGDSDFTFRAKKEGFRLIAFPQLVIYNDNTNTGLIHKGSARKLYQSLTSIKSNFNIRKDFAFYRKHARSHRAYYPLWSKYFRYIGGFTKWSVLGLAGIKRKQI